MTSKAVKEFYNRKHKTTVQKSPPGLIGWTYTRLKRFETHRVSTAIYLINGGDRFLDMGMGGGVIIAECKKQNMFREYYGVDITPIVIRLARKEIKKTTGDVRGVKLQCLDLNEKLPYKNKYFSTITCIAVLEHIFDPYFTISEISRVLKKGGTLILEVPNLVWLPRRVSMLFGILPITAHGKGWDGGHLHYFTIKTTVDLLNAYGFSVVYSGCTGILSPVLNLAPSILGGNIIIKAIKE